jgi:hypothetical protein
MDHVPAAYASVAAISIFEPVSDRCALSQATGTARSGSADNRQPRRSHSCWIGETNSTPDRAATWRVNSSIRIVSRLRYAIVRCGTTPELRHRLTIRFSIRHAMQPPIGLQQHDIRFEQDDFAECV